jgi:hypothetical protein
MATAERLRAAAPPPATTEEAALAFRVDHMPYDSGAGREGLRYAIEEMTELKLLTFNSPPLQGAELEGRRDSRGVEGAT